MIEVSTTEYQFSHGKLPRGRGSWAFQIGRDAESIFWSTPNRSYGEAVRDARKLAVARKAYVVKVLP